MNHNATESEQDEIDRIILSTVAKSAIVNSFSAAFGDALSGVCQPVPAVRTVAVRPKCQGDLDAILMRVAVAPNGCWEWQGAKSKAGYGRVKHYDGQRTFLALPHRVVAHAMGLIDAVRADPYRNVVVMHTCDNRLCCRPEHLKVGTSSDNMRDCVRKGRAPWQKRK